jgi:Flp pilus assembly protein TadG
MSAALTTRKLARSATRRAVTRTFLLRNDIVRDDFVRNDRGATAVEFALVAAPFLALLVALFQTAMVFFAGRMLDEITEEASRYVMTGQAQTSNMTASQFATYVCTGDPVLTKLVSALFTCSKLLISAQSYSSFAAANTNDPIAGFNASNQPVNSNGNVITMPWAPGNPGDIVVLQIMYQWPVVGGPLGFSLSSPNSNGYRLLMSTAIFRNEPY